MKRFFAATLFSLASAANGATSICDQLADTTFDMSRYRQAGFSYDRIVDLYARAVATSELNGSQQLSLDNMHRYIASVVFSVPLRDASTDAQRAQDQELAGRIKMECIHAGGQ